MQMKKEYRLRKLTLSSVKKTLKEGDKLKYCKLCELLGQPKYTGAQKSTQLKEFSRYFDFEKEGMYFTITNIHSKEQRKILTKSLRSDAVFPNCILYLLQNDIYPTEGNTVIYPVQKWWQRLGMNNPAYLISKNSTKAKRELKALDPCMEIDDINYFYRRSGRDLWRIFDNALKSLKKRDLIVTEQAFMIVSKPGEEARPLKNEEERKIWIDTQNQVLDSFGLKEYAQLQYLPECVTMGFYNKVERLRREIAGWEKGFTALKVSITDKGLAYPVSLSEDTVSEVRNKLNEGVLSSVNKQIVNKKLPDYARSDNKYFGKEFDEEVKSIGNSTVTLQLLLSDKLLACHN